MYVDYEALKVMNDTLEARSAVGNLQVHVSDIRSDEGVHVFIEFHKHPDRRELASPAIWETAGRMFAAMLSPQGTVKKAGLFESPSIMHVEVQGYVSVDEVERLSREALARFREAQLLKAKPAVS